jgi:hypothetical protein
MGDYRTHQATVASSTFKDQATSKDQATTGADFVRICVCGGSSRFPISSFEGSIPCGDNPASIARGSGALLQGVC